MSLIIKGLHLAWSDSLRFKQFELFPFAMWQAFPAADYYENSANMMDVRGSGHPQCNWSCFARGRSMENVPVAPHNPGGANQLAIGCYRRTRLLLQDMVTVVLAWRHKAGAFDRGFDQIGRGNCAIDFDHPMNDDAPVDRCAWYCTETRVCALSGRDLRCSAVACGFLTKRPCSLEERGWTQTDIVARTARVSALFFLQFYEPAGIQRMK